MGLSSIGQLNPKHGGSRTACNNSSKGKHERVITDCRLFMLHAQPPPIRHLSPAVSIKNHNRIAVIM